MNKKEEMIYKSGEAKRIEIGHTTIENEVVYRFIVVQGTDKLGFIASYEEWFSPNQRGGDEPEFSEVLFDTTIYQSIDEAVADAMPDAIEETRKFIESNHPETDIVQGTILNASEFEITNGYVGALGMTYETATEKKLNLAIGAAALRHDVTAEEIKKRLLAGKSVAWCDSPNYYYDHSSGMIRKKRAKKEVVMIPCACGHSVPRDQVMNSSLGTSCPDCYDRMSQ